MRLWSFDSEIGFKVRIKKIALIKNGGIKIYCRKIFIVHDGANIYHIESILYLVSFCVIELTKSSVSPCSSN